MFKSVALQKYSVGMSDGLFGFGLVMVGWGPISRASIFLGKIRCAVELRFPIVTVYSKIAE